MRLIEAPPTPHSCRLPWDSGGYGSTGVPIGTLAVCDECGKAWFCAPCFESLGPTEHWRRVRWFHWRLRKRIEATAP